MATRAPKVIAVYIRKGPSEDARIISFNPPPELSRADIVRLGYAMDRSSALLSVAPRPRFGNPNDPEAWKGPIIPLTEALHDAQKALQEWLEARGYTVEWK